MRLCIDQKSILLSDQCQGLDYHDDRTTFLKHIVVVVSIDSDNPFF